ncbi:MAG: STAS domain-containing protein [Eubacterium sp.]|nr:STAS domain-containing protein [Eubacterium sp.]
MNIIKNVNGSSMEVVLEGRLDTATSPELESALKDSLDDITDLTFNMEKLEYISSSGLRVLLATQKTMNKKGNMKIVNANEMIMEIFDVTGFVDILTIE